MKATYRSWLAVISSFLILTSCLKDDQSVCPPGEDSNVIIYFTMHDEDGDDIFSQNIDHVDLILFDSEYRYVSWFTVGSSSLEELQGMKFYAAPGLYHIAAWGNMTEQTRVDESTVELLPNSVLSFPTTTLADPLHYAPSYDWTPTRSPSDNEFDRFVLHVPQTGTHTHYLEFMCAYRMVKVWVKGLEDMEKEERPMPRIELTHVTPGYDFMLHTREEEVNYSIVSVDTKTPQGWMAYGRFNTPFFELNENIEINIYNGSDGNHVYCLPLAPFLWSQEKYPELHETIEILIEFLMDGSVKVGLVNWNWTGVDPI